jgi:hypothetical protein
VDLASFWVGFATACAVWVIFGLTVGAISFRVTIDKDGVDVKRTED